MVALTRCNFDRVCDSSAQYILVEQVERNAIGCVCIFELQSVAYLFLDCKSGVAKHIKKCNNLQITFRCIYLFRIYKYITATVTKCDK